MSEVNRRIERNLFEVYGRMKKACARAGRSMRAIQLVAVTKYVGIEEVRALRALGVIHMGESRVSSDTKAKIEALDDLSVLWHMIGNVQRRKANEVVEYFDIVDSVDRLSLAEALQRHCELLDTCVDVLIEVNVSGEASKQGVAPGDVGNLLAGVRTLDNIDPRGLLTMAPLDADEATLRKVFRTLRVLAEDHGLPEVSMGMSGDFEIAIEEGATQVRIGQALFQ